MSLLETPAKFDAEKVMKVQIGLMSPMWLPVAGAAAFGLAAWNMTRWMRLAPPQAVVELAAAPELEVVEEIVAVAADAVTEAPLPLIEPEPVPVPVETVAAVAVAQAKAAKPATKTPVRKPAVKKAAAVAAKKPAPVAIKKSAGRKARATAH